MPESFRTKRQRFIEALDRADAAFTDARALLDDLPATAASERDTRQVLEAHQTMRETLRAQQRNLDKQLGAAIQHPACRVDAVHPSEHGVRCHRG